MTRRARGIGASVDDDFDDAHLREGYSESDAESSSSETASSGGSLPEHYTDVGTTDLRKSADKQRQQQVIDEELNKMNSGGRKISRKELYGSSSDSDETNSDNEEIDSEKDSEQVSSDSDQLNSDDERVISVEERLNHNAEEPSKYGVRHENRNKNHRLDDKLQETAVDGEEERLRADLLMQFDQSIPRSVSVSDAVKGRHIRNQIECYEMVLDLRIRLQKSFVEQKRSIQNGTSNAIEEEKRKAIKSTAIDALNQISRMRFPISEALKADDQRIYESTSRSNDSIDFDEDNNDQIYLYDDIKTDWDVERILDEISERNDDALSNAEDVIRRYSDRINAASELLHGSKFKKRETRDPVVFVRTQVKQEMQKWDSQNLYDDADFYSTLLREFINSKMEQEYSTAEIADATAVLRSRNGADKKRKKANVDTRASKGRKLRYNVVDKLQNFMAPIRTVQWQDEQIDELFASIMGSKKAIQNGHFDDQQQVTSRANTQDDLGDVIDDDFKLIY